MIGVTPASHTARSTVSMLTGCCEPSMRPKVAWRRTEKTVAFSIVVPFGAEAEVVLPAAPKTVKMNGKTVAAKNLVLRAGATTFNYAPAGQPE